MLAEIAMRPEIERQRFIGRPVESEQTRRRGLRVTEESRRKPHSPEIRVATWSSRVPFLSMTSRRTGR